MRSTKLVIALSALLTGTPQVFASTETEREEETARELRVPLVIIENLVLTVPSAVYYWSTPGIQKADWELHWDWASWKAKLVTFDAIVLDTNQFEANAIRHPIVGALTYQIGRANGFGRGASTAMSFAMSVLWEYLVEFREKPAINDILANTTSSILIGEPLFQIGLVADDHPSIPRRLLALVVSPFHRVQKDLELSPLDERPPDPNRLLAFAGGDLSSQSGAGKSIRELRFGLDLETFHDDDFGLPGRSSHRTGIGAWNRANLEVRFGGNHSGLTGIEVRTSTTYLGWFGRDLDEERNGRQLFAGFGAGVDILERRLASEWDKYATFHLLEPRVGTWFRSPLGELDLEAGVSGDIAMVQSTARALIPLIPMSSVLLSRGYYYATGLTAQARVRASHERFHAEVEGIAHQFWSFDEHSHGGNHDPRDNADQRLSTRAFVGARVFDDVSIDLYGEHVIRRGTSESLSRETTETDGGVQLTAGF